MNTYTITFEQNMFRYANKNKKNYKPTTLLKKNKHYSTDVYKKALPLKTKPLKSNHKVLLNNLKGKGEEKTFQIISSQN